MLSHRALSSLPRPLPRILSGHATCPGTQASAPGPSFHRCKSTSTSSSSASSSSLRQFRSSLFSAEQRRQLELMPRLEKIQVAVEPPPGREDQEPIKMILNKGMSTPFHAAKHLTEDVVDRSALALVDDTRLWDMNRPLQSDCSLRLLHFHIKDPYHVNRAFWRSCSFILGAVIDSVFKEDLNVELHSFPVANVASGCFIHDADLKLPSSDWSPSKQELMVFSAAMHRLAEQSLPFERLDVSEELASEIFKDNQYKLSQIPSIAASVRPDESDTRAAGPVTLYRVGDHVDISRGPMVGNTSFLGRRCTIAAAHPITHDGKEMFRFQGVALPKGMHLSHFAFGVLEKRATILNKANLDPENTFNQSEASTSK